ncbi:MAG TPA: tetratricopeptide repeat protein [Candidatus Angelobacter sp.]|jgi:tetratricopeptide (TPR) repeat protein|nr:tetratricopeptide repeat protein [Candidatus Angelobacter sp.]
MNKTGRVLTILAVLLALLSAVGCDKLRARDQINKGVNAYKNAKYEEAIEHFKDAVQLDPTLLNARLYLATAYMQQYIPGADSPENNKYAEQAIAEFKTVLDTTPPPPKEQRILALKGIASLYFNMKKMDEAKKYHQMVADLDPNDPEVYYSIAVIDWTQAYQPRIDARAKLGLKPSDTTIDKKTCVDLLKAISANQAVVEDGISKLNKAIELRPDYDDAMAYLNLMYRERADLECDNPDARKADLKTADDWVDKTIATKKVKAEKAGPSGLVTTDSPTK